MHNFRGNSADSAGTLADVAATGHAAVIAATPYITPIIANESEHHVLGDRAHPILVAR